MSNLRTIRAFSVELMKIASGIKDAEIQKLLADRRGEEYLEGGRLPNELPEEKLAAGGYEAPLGMSASGNYDHKANKKKSNHYQKVRDYAGTAVKGGLTGLGILGATNAMRGRFSAPDGFHAVRKATKAARNAAIIGSGVAVADRAYRHDELPGATKTANIGSNPNASFKSPAVELANSQRTGSFRSGVHNVGTAPKPLQLGKKFRLP